VKAGVKRQASVVHIFFAKKEKSMKKLCKNLKTNLLTLCFLFVVTLIGITSSGVSAELDTGLLSSWPNFRGNDANNAVVSDLTPTSMENAALYWSTLAGVGYDTQAPSSPILVGDDLVYTTSKNIVKMDSVSGETITTGTMCKNSNFNITPPTYGDGMIFVALKDGTIQAFDADTLQSLWIFQDALEGQPNCPITYYNGYIYTGFWNSETQEANYVCLSVTDTDINSEDEEKSATWTFNHAGGYYWAGCYASDDFVIFGSENGTDGGNDSSVIYSLNPLTGAEIDKVTGIVGDTRSSICYDSVTDRYYFTSGGGYFYSFAVNSNGTFDDSSVKYIQLSGASTSTPVVYNGRAYVGVQGTGQFDVYSGHNISVIDLTNWEIAYTCPTQGFPQTSGLLTTAYVGTTGYVYVYFIDNYTPGKIRVIKDKQGQTSMISSSSYAPILFTPANDDAQYAICSPISDQYGTIYFKNDSAKMMALGSKITKIEITDQPDKTVYNDGDIFDPTGMQITAYYSNGLTRDISNYVSYVNGYDDENNPVYVSASDLTTALTGNDTQISVYFTYQMYQDADNKIRDDQNKVNQTISKPYDTVDITVHSENDQQATDAVIALISALDGKISDASVAAARAAYDDLTAYQKSLISNYAKLTAAENTIKNKPFTDVKSGSWYYEEAYFAYYNGLMNGTDSNVFDPVMTTTRGMLVTILYRFEGSPAVSGNSPFTDLTQDWYKDAVLWAYQNGIVSGMERTIFAPNQPITREQLATILYRYCDSYKEYDVSDSASLGSFPDAASVSDYATKAMQWAVAKEYITGTLENGKTYLDPGGNAVRAQVAAIMMRFIESL
jgi:hypothetical protein